jgi:hypothetical protein
MDVYEVENLELGISDDKHVPGHHNDVSRILTEHSDHFRAEAVAPFLESGRGLNHRRAFFQALLSHFGQKAYVGERYDRNPKLIGKVQEELSLTRLFILRPVTGFTVAENPVDFRGRSAFS